MTTKLRPWMAVPVALLVAVLALAGWGARDRGADSGGSASTADKLSSPASDTSRTRAEGRALTKTTTATPPLSRAVISNGEISLRSSSPTRDRAEVVRLVSSWGGTVADEQTDSDRHGRIVSSTLTLRVPSERFSEAMTALARIGHVQHQSRTSEDVTTQVIDTDARVRAAERSIRSIEALLSRARRLSDVIAIESDLARRQADLDSLKSQQAWLEDQTSLSTISVQLDRPEVAPPSGQRARGFLAGLDRGWHALASGGVVLLTVAGALLPFAVLAGLVGVPVGLVVRRRRPADPAAPTGA